MLQPSIHTAYREGTHVPGLDALKLIAAIFVVLIHTMYGGGLHIFLRLAVPVFFVITGFFLPDVDGTISAERSGRALKKAVRLLVIANIVIACAYLFFYLITDVNLIQQQTTIRDYIAAATIGITFGWQLWYLMALVEAMLIIHIATYLLKRQKLLIVIAIVSLLLIKAYDMYLHFNPDSDYHFSIVHNGLMPALPWVIMGVLLRRYQKCLPGKRTLWIIFAAGLMLSYAEYRFDMGATYRLDILWGTVIAVPALTALALQTHGTPTLRLVANLGQRYSFDIYLWHFAVMMAVSAIFSEVSRYWWLIYIFVITFVVSIISSAVRTIFHKRRASLGISSSKV